MRPELRVEHIAALRPDICTLDLNTMNSGGQVVINTPENVRRMASVIREAGVKPEIELFDSGDIALMHDLIADGTLDAATAVLHRHGRALRFPAVAGDRALRAQACCRRGRSSPPSALAATFSPPRRRAILAGGQVRVGIEDGVYLSRGVLAPSNAAMVAKIRGVVEALGAEIAQPVRGPRPARPAHARRRLKLSSSRRLSP